MIRFLMAQINTRVADVQGNLALSIAAVQRGRELGCDVVALPEMTLLGYPPKDLLLYKNVIERNEAALQEFARCTAGGPAAVIGFAEGHKGHGAGLYNCAAYCEGGVVRAIYRKWLLPTYDVFDEARYFDEGRETCIVDVKGTPVAITICEDLWNDELYWSHRRYHEDPILEAVKAGGRLIVNISASPFALGKRAVRRSMMRDAARRHGAPLVHVNLVGGNDDLIFDGMSGAFDSQGDLIGRCDSFVDCFTVVEIDEKTGKSPAGAIEDESFEEIEELRRGLNLGLRDYAKKCGFRKALIGLSGGIDSALVAALAAEALGAENIRGIAMPSRYSSAHSETDAQDLARNLGIKYETIPIESMFAVAQSEIAPHFNGADGRLALENMQARLRGITLMSLSNASGELLLTTGNKSEISVGYCTLYGDMCGGLAGIGDLLKTRVYELSRWLNTRAGREVIPESTLTKEPSAELAPNQKDSDSLPPYDVLDAIIVAYVEQSLGEEQIVALGHDGAVVKKVLRLLNNSEYKRRQAAPTLKVTGRAFGYGWRMPIARG